MVESLGSQSHPHFRQHKAGPKKSVKCVEKSLPKVSVDVGGQIKQKAKRGNSTLNTVFPKTENNFYVNPNKIIFGHFCIFGPFCIFGLVKVTLGC